MTIALLVLAGVLLVVAFVGGLFAGRKSIATGSPTPQSANAAAPDTTADADAAADAAGDKAVKKAEEVMHAPDDAVRDRVAKLRARGRAGE